MNLLGTSTGRLFRVSIAAAAAGVHLAITSLADSKGLLSRVTASLFPSMMAPSTHDPVVSLVAHDERNTVSPTLWVLTTGRIQRWKLSSDTWDEVRF